MTPVARDVDQLARDHRASAVGLHTVPAVLAVVVLLGWWLRSSLLVTFGTSVAMQFNTALGILLCSAGLSLRRPWGTAAAAIALVLGAATLVEHGSGMSIGIDMLFPSLFGAPAGVNVGRMAWQTALSLTIVSAALIALRSSANAEWRSAAAGVGGSIVLSTMLFVMTGALVTGGIVDWRVWSTVSLGTALSLICFAVLLLRAARVVHPRDRRTRWIPLATLLAVVTFGGLLWQWLRNAETGQIVNHVQLAASETAARLETGKAVTESAIRRMANRWTVAQGTPRDQWEADARDYARDLGLVHVWLVDRSGATQIVSRPGVVAPPTLQQDVREWCGTLRGTGDSFARHVGWMPDRTATGNPMARLDTKGAFDGCVGGTVRWDEVLARAIPANTPVVAEAVFDGAVLARVGAPSDVVGRYRVASLQEDSRLSVRLAPTATLIGRERSWSPDLALLAFAGFALLAAWATRSSQVALERQAALLAAAEFTATARQQAAVALENSGQGWWDWDLRSGTALLDDTWHRLMGWEPGEIAEPIAAWTSSIHPDDAPAVHAALARHLESDDARYDVDYRARRKDGTWVWMNTRGRVQARDQDGRAVRMIGTLQDISQRKRLEQATEDSLREKEILLREIHHRVKNNLAVVSSLLYLQSTETTDSAALRILKDSQDRTRSMAMVHDLLYRSNDLSRIDFGEYLRRLAGYLKDSHQGGPSTVFDLEAVQVSVEAAVACGLLVNELITNAYKHALSSPAGRLRISLRYVEGHVVITIEDNGPGFTADADPTSASTLGLRLVRSLADQLDGTVVFRSAVTGTEVELRFPLADAVPVARVGGAA